GDLMADFILERTPLLKYVDAVVPIPHAPEKTSRRGFGPNYVLGERIGERLALPLWDVLRRREGVATRQATASELAAQFEVAPGQARKLKGRSVVLLEDIWTTGRTFQICTDKLRACEPKEVFAVALAKTE